MQFSCSFHIFNIFFSKYVVHLWCKHVKKSVQFIHFSKLRYFVLWKIITEKMYNFIPLVPLSKAMFMFQRKWWPENWGLFYCHSILMYAAARMHSASFFAGQSRPHQCIITSVMSSPAAYSVLWQHKIWCCRRQKWHSLSHHCLRSPSYCSTAAISSTEMIVSNLCAE